MPTNNSINNTIKITTYNAGSTTWTPDSRTKIVEIFGWGAGSGGGSGRKGTTALSGGGGGGGAGGFFYSKAPVGYFNASGETVVVGTGGAGGLSQTATADGNPGSAGTANTQFGNLIALVGTVGAAGINGSASGVTNQPVYSLGGDASTSFQSGTGANAAGSAISNVTISKYPSPGGGGGGGGANSVTERAGGLGAGILKADSTTLIAGGAGGLESTGINGAPGVSILTTGSMVSGGSGGGGGGGYSVGALGATKGGTGGKGGTPGGGGGGGGGGLATVADSGVGGQGGDGLIIVIEYF